MIYIKKYPIYYYQARYVVKYFTNKTTLRTHNNCLITRITWFYWQVGLYIETR